MWALYGFVEKESLEEDLGGFYGIRWNCSFWSCELWKLSLSWRGVGCEKLERGE
jgi:hypothetical protein